MKETPPDFNPPLIIRMLGYLFLLILMIPIYHFKIIIINTQINGIQAIK